MKLSVVLATFNEEENIGNCLDSVNAWCNEIVVVDGFSTDKTREIAKTYGARVVKTKNVSIFHINKQKAIDLARGDWILQLDADELVTDELKKEIDGIINNNNNTNGYWIPRKNYFLGRFLMKGGVYPDYTLRLYKKGKGRLPQKDVHEQAVVEGPVGYLKNPLIHMADPSFRRYLVRFGRYTELLAKEIANEPACFTCQLIKYVFIKPIHWFFMQYIRHKGFMDGWQGFLFSFFSALRFPIAYIKYLRQYS